MSKKDSKISPTAHYTAYIWKRLGLPYSSIYATPRGARMFWSLRILVEWIPLMSKNIPTMEQYLIQRHLVIDHLVLGLKPDRLIEIAAGLSRRATTWAIDHRVPSVELDLPEMAEIKKQLIDSKADPEIQKAIGSELIIETSDVMSEGFSEVLKGYLRGYKNPVVITEGLLGYFGYKDRLRIVSSIAKALQSEKGGSLICDVDIGSAHARMSMAVTVMKLIINMITGGRGGEELFKDEQETHQFFEKAGFASIERIAPLDLINEIRGLPNIYAPVSIYLSKIKV